MTEPMALPSTGRCGAGGDDLAIQLVRGGAWTGGAQVVAQSIGLAATLIVARLLTPADFGLMAMGTAVIGMLFVLLSDGFAAVTVQRDQLRLEEQNTLFWLQAALSIGLAATVVAVALVWLDGLFSQVLMALVFAQLPASCTSQHEALLRRSLRFQEVAGIGLLGTLTGAVMTVGLALCGAGVWALVGGTLFASLVIAARRLAVLRWRPGPPVWSSLSQGFWRLGGAVSLMAFVQRGTRSLDKLILGAMLDPTSVGLYARAQSLFLLPVTHVARPLSVVVVPALSRRQGDPEGFRHLYLAALAIAAAAGCLLLGALGLASPLLVRLLLGDQWDAVVPIFLVMAPAALLSVVSGAIGWLVLPFGRSRLLIRIALLGGGAELIGVTLGACWGSLGAAAGFTIAALVARPLQLKWALSPAAVSWRDVGGALLPPFIGMCAGLCVVLLIRPPVASLLTAPDALRELLVYAAVYAAVLAASPARRRYWSLMRRLYAAC